MALALLIAFQAAASAPVPIDFDLAKLPADGLGFNRCVRHGAGDIVVCGRRGDGYRITALDGRFDEKPLVAETSIAPGVSVRAFGDSADMPGGHVSKRALVGVRVKF